MGMAGVDVNRTLRNAGVDFAVRLLVDELDRLLEGGGRDPHQAGIGQAEFEDEEDREGDRQRAERQRRKHQRVGLGEQADAEKQREG